LLDILLAWYMDKSQQPWQQDKGHN
jgi:hypothetical protein